LVPDLSDLEAAARSAVWDTQEAKRLYMRLLRRCFENLPPLQRYPVRPKRERRVEKILYLPIEVAARELASKEWLAQRMPGWKVVIGARWPMQMDWIDIPPGVVLMKTANHLDVGMFQEAVDAGHLVAVLDEEMFGIKPDPDLYDISLDRDALGLADLICAQSEQQAEIYRGLTDTPVEVTGNPRTLITEPKGGGTKVLVCTMGGTINNYGRSFFDMVETTCRVLGDNSGRAFDLFAESISHELDLAPLVRRAVLELQKAGKDCIIRTHPVEDPTLWSKLGPIDESGSFGEALDDAAVVVFCSGCGTGLEAALAGIPSVRLGEGGHGISQTMGTTHENVVEAVNTALPTAIDKADVTLPQALMRLQAANSFECPYFDIPKAYEGKSWVPQPFHANKMTRQPLGQPISWMTSYLETPQTH